MKTIRDLFNEHKSGGWLDTGALLAALEAREAERDEAERERVQNALKPWIQAAIKGWKSINMHTLLSAIYPPPKPEKLPAGWYWARNKSLEWSPWICEKWSEVDLPKYSGWEFRPWNDPPPEVTGKAEPTLPTFEEWCGANVKGWDDHGCAWYRSSAYGGMHRNVPDDVFNAVEVVPSCGNQLQYDTPQQARHSLRAALLKLGRIRE